MNGEGPLREGCGRRFCTRGAAPRRGRSAAALLACCAARQSKPRSAVPYTTRPCPIHSTSTASCLPRGDWPTDRPGWGAVSSARGSAPRSPSCSQGGWCTSTAS